MKVEIEVRSTIEGPEHVYLCAWCEDGEALYCAEHSTRGSCPCAVRVECDECHGLGQYVETDCGCSLCEQVREDLEKRGVLQ